MTTEKKKIYQINGDKLVGVNGVGVAIAPVRSSYVAKKDVVSKEGRLIQTKGNVYVTFLAVDANRPFVDTATDEQIGDLNADAFRLLRLEYPAGSELPRNGSTMLLTIEESSRGLYVADAKPNDERAKVVGIASILANRKVVVAAPPVTQDELTED